MGSAGAKVAGTTAPSFEPPTDRRAFVLQTEDNIEQPDVSNEVLEKYTGHVNEVVELAASDLQDSQIKEELSNLIGAHKRSSWNRGRHRTVYGY